MVEMQELHEPHEQASQVNSGIRHTLTSHENCLREFSELCEHRKVIELCVQTNFPNLCEGDNPTSEDARTTISLREE